MAQGILIDLDDTLSDDRFATRQAVASLCRTHFNELNQTPEALLARWFALTDKHWRRFRAGETTLQGQRRDRLAELFGQELALSEADAMFAEYLSHYEQNWRLSAGASMFLKATAGIPKVIVTNGELHQSTRKVAALDVGGHFIAIVSPEVAGAAKPKPEIFAYALRLLNMSAPDCLMIGDSYEFDIAPAKALGMAAFHVGDGTSLAEAANVAHV